MSTEDDLRSMIESLNPREEAMVLWYLRALRVSRSKANPRLGEALADAKRIANELGVTDEYLTRTAEDAKNWARVGGV